MQKSSDISGTPYDLHFECHRLISLYRLLDLDVGIYTLSPSDYIYILTHRDLIKQLFRLVDRSVFITRTDLNTYALSVMSSVNLARDDYMDSAMTNCS